MRNKTGELPNTVEDQVLRTARAARVSPRRAALELAARAEKGMSGSSIGMGSREADAAALRGLAHLYGGKVKAILRDELREEMREVAGEIGVDPGALSAAMVRLLERGVVDIEPRAEALGHLRHLARGRLKATR